MGLKQFLTGDQRLILLGAILLLYVGFRVFQYFLSRNKPRTVLPLGTQREYGFAGGAVCPNCHRPVVLSLLGLKLGFGVKLVRCEFCGKWSLMHRASQNELRAAEAAELAELAAGPTGDRQERREKDARKDRRVEVYEVGAGLTPAGPRSSKPALATRMGLILCIGVP